jgi:hypothetical protein
VDPVKMMRSIKYKSGKLLNINDRTYTIKVLVDIVNHIIDSLKLSKAFRCERFLTSKLPKKEKLVILIFSLDLVFNDYLTATKGNSDLTFTNWLRDQVANILCVQYTDLIDNKTQSDWCQILSQKETDKMCIEKLLSKYVKDLFSAHLGAKKPFRKQIRDLKKDKFSNSKNKLTSIEPNTIMHMLTLGYITYLIKEKPSMTYSISDLLSCCSQYLKFTEKFPKTLSTSNNDIK